ncbi:MAG TPA: LamG domain-containing protein [Steroidobacteraceae bacterium]|nr:LamG domain-containing protein [Steroidobacteraceae bacterium]
MNRIASVRMRVLAALVPALATLALAGCGGGASTEENPATTPPPPAGYSGPPPASQDVQAFKLNVWDNLQASNRCGACHGTGGQVPGFVRSDDINLAYEAANGVVDLANPADSTMVTKVGGGHNCWLGADSACADQLTVWIHNWAGQTLGGTRGAPLQPPPMKEVGASKSFPADSALFGSTVYPLLTQYCSRCHSSGSATPQSPFFAESDVDAAYAAVRAKIDLDTPANSRLVVRLRNEFHNCWTDCATAANAMQAAIQDFSDGVPLTQVDPDLVISKALTLYDGTVASGGNRFDNAAIALYEFKTGTGTVAYDTSGVEPALNLTLSGAVTWVGGWGIDLRGGKAQGTTASSRKLHDLIKATGEYSIEAWVAPANVVQEMAHIVGYSGGATARNFTLAQTMYNYDYLNRATTTGANGSPVLSTPAADEVLQATLQHVVATYSAVDGRRIYVNGELRSQADPAPAGLFTDWNDTFALVLGNEVSNDRIWQGVIRMVAIHNRALTEAQIAQNFDAGVGERFYLLFSVSHLVNVPQSYVMFEASQFDSYSYLFNEPSFISLDGAATPDQIRIQGVRIGVNGAEARVGQAYAPLDETVTAAGYTAATGFGLSGLGTVVALDKGPSADEFFLSFERIAANTHPHVEPPATPLPPPPDADPASQIGLRTFEELSTSMSVMTGVPTTNANVAATYDRVRQQLPTVENIEGFLSSHQVGAAQLAIEYCNELVDDTGLRGTYFPGFNFGAAAATAFDTPAERAQITGPLTARAVGTGLATQPTAAEISAEVDALMGRLTACGGACAADRTEVVVKAACSAVIGSASTLLQ